MTYQQQPTLSSSAGSSAGSSNGTQGFSFMNSLSADDFDFDGADAGTLLPSTQGQQQQQFGVASSSRFASIDDMPLTLGMFKQLMDTQYLPALPTRDMIQKLVDTMEAANAKRKAYSLCLLFLAARKAELDDFGKSLKKLYGTKEQRKYILDQPCRYGTRDKARGTKAGNNKTLFYAAMVEVYKKIDPGFIPDKVELDKRYSCCFGIVKSIILTLIVPGNPNMESWNKLHSKLQNFYSLLVEDFIETQLGSGRDGYGLPLYATNNHYGLNLFLSPLVRSVLESPEMSYTLGKKPAIGGRGTDAYHDVLLCKVDESIDSSDDEQEEQVQEEVDVEEDDVEEVDEPVEQVSIDESDDEDDMGSSPPPTLAETPAQRRLRKAQEQVDKEKRLEKEAATAKKNKKKSPSKPAPINKRRKSSKN